MLNRQPPTRTRLRLYKKNFWVIQEKSVAGFKGSEVQGSEVQGSKVQGSKVQGSWFKVHGFSGPRLRGKQAGIRRSAFGARPTALADGIGMRGNKAGIRRSAFGPRFWAMESGCGVQDTGLIATEGRKRPAWD